jgi:hypothetical protein
MSEMQRRMTLKELLPEGLPFPVVSDEVAR